MSLPKSSIEETLGLIFVKCLFLALSRGEKRLLDIVTFIIRKKY